MKINPVVNYKPAFKALMIEKRHNLDVTQNAIISDVLRNPQLSKKLIKNLEARNTDLYISSDETKRNVKLRLLTEGGLTYNFVPKDETGKKIELRFTAYDDDMDIDVSLAEFVDKAMKFVRGGFQNAQNTIAREKLASISEKDMMSKNMYRIQRPDNLPNAECLMGVPQVTTANRFFPQRKNAK